MLVNCTEKGRHDACPCDSYVSIKLANVCVLAQLDFSLIPFHYPAERTRQSTLKLGLEVYLDELSKDMWPGRPLSWVDTIKVFFCELDHAYCSSLRAHDQRHS